MSQGKPAVKRIIGEPTTGRSLTRHAFRFLKRVACDARPLPGILWKLVVIAVRMPPTVGGRNLSRKSRITRCVSVLDATGFETANYRSSAFPPTRTFGKENLG